MVSSHSPTASHSSQAAPPVPAPPNASPAVEPDPENAPRVAPSEKEKDGRDGKSDEKKDKYLVDWEPNDVSNPQNWSKAYKSWITFQLGMLALAASLGSSIISPAEDAIMKYTYISSEVAVLPISFYILGFAVGPLLWAPVSEVRTQLHPKQIYQL